MKSTIKELQGIIQKKGQQATPQSAKKLRTQKKKAVAPTHKEDATPVQTGKLRQLHENKLEFKTRLLNYNVVGRLPMDFSSLKVTLLVTEDTSFRSLPYKVDLYEHEQVREAIQTIAGHFYISEELVGVELLQLASLLEKYRDEQVITHKVKLEESGKMPHGDERNAKALLSGHNIMSRIDKLMEKAGIKGQEHIRLMMFLAASSYKNAMPLHLGIKGSTNIANKLIDKVAEFIPLEDILLLNNVSARSFYHCSHSELMNKALLLPNGLENKAAQAFKLLQQGETLITATTKKDTLGDMVSAVRQVKSHFSSIAFLPETNTGNSGIIITSPDESIQQIERLVQYHNEKLAGQVDEEEEKRAADMLRHIIYCIEPMEVINPHASKITIPVQADMMVAMNSIFQAAVSQICLLHQYQRKRDKQDRLIAQVEDIRMASDILFNAMSMEIDEFEPSTKKFFADLKAHVLKKAGEKAKEYWFTMRELRHEMSIAKTSCFRFMDELRELEYVERDGYANKGLRYRIVYWDDMEKNGRKTRDSINAQLDRLGVPHIKYSIGTPEPNTAEVSADSVPSAA